MNNTNAAASYGIKGVPAATNDPGARYQCTSNWVADNKLWLIGGRRGIGDQGNDLWSYDLLTNPTSQKLLENTVVIGAVHHNDFDSDGDATLIGVNPIVSPTNGTISFLNSER